MNFKKGWMEYILRKNLWYAYKDKINEMYPLKINGTKIDKEGMECTVCPNKHGNSVTILN